GCAGVGHAGWVHLHGHAPAGSAAAPCRASSRRSTPPLSRRRTRTAESGDFVGETASMLPRRGGVEYSPGEMVAGEEREQAEALAKRVRVGIVTVLPEERAAILAMFDRTYPWSFPGQGAGLVYDLGVLPARGGGSHVVALALAGMGNNVAAARGTLLLTHFPGVEAILMTGIAGGGPGRNPR